MRIRAVFFHLDPTTAENAKLTSEFGDILPYLIRKNLALAIVIDESSTLVEKLQEQMRPFSLADVDVVIDPHETLPPSANTSPIQLAAERLKIAPDQILVVASEAVVLREARLSGAFLVSYDHLTGSQTMPIDSDYRISTLKELEPIVRMGIPLPAGKLPNDLLREFLNQFKFDDPSILINPGVGEDTAAVDVESEEVLVLKSDPITFATDAIGQYAVLINANDIATSGARPRWLLTTLLFPLGVTPFEIHKVISELKEFCRLWGITLCGGHTEITDAVARPVVTGMMAGTVARHNLIDKRNMAAGDRVLLTKGVSVEGTAIIAREFGDRLAELGMAASEIKRCRLFLADISIIKEAQIAARSRATSAMHDVTEGGLATALAELSIAGGHRIKVDLDAIPVFSETQKIGRLLGIEPLGLIGSGSLLICCRESGCESLINAIRQSGIEVCCIGEVLEDGPGIRAIKKGQSTDWPQFEVDEITRLF